MKMENNIMIEDIDDKLKQLDKNIERYSKYKKMEVADFVGMSAIIL